MIPPPIAGTLPPSARPEKSNIEPANLAANPLFISSTSSSDVVAVVVGVVGAVVVGTIGGMI